MKYREYKGINYAEVAEEVLEFWKDKEIFQKSIDEREGQSTFTFYEGPPSANGTPGIHHVMARTVKDIFCRYKTLKGFQVKRKGGWDTHGLPVELQVEKELDITKEDIGTKISVEEYNNKCREAVMKFKDQWDDLTVKMGYWVDLDNPYITFERDYMESLWWLLSKFYEKGLLYKGYTIQPYSPAAGTGLSSHELNQPGTYQQVKDTSIVAQFKVENNGKSSHLFKGVDTDLFILAWTTTPWTLPANNALAVGKNIEYVRVKTFNPYTFLPVTLMLAKDRVSVYFTAKAKELALEDYKEGDKLIPYEVTGSFKGSELAGVDYEQLLPYVSLPKPAFTVVIGDFVTTEDGTGIVHTSLTFGADDYRVSVQNNVPGVFVKDDEGKEVPIVDKQGRFVKEITDFAGRYVKEEYYGDDVRKEADFKPTDVLIAIKLKEENKAFKVEKYEHSYPHCWRTDKPILYYPLESWFIKTTAFKEQLVRLNNTINWKPASTGQGRFGNWLENLVDWNLSRSRYWGTPLPIWSKKYGAKTSNDLICVGSLADFKKEGWHYLSVEKFETFAEKLRNASFEIYHTPHDQDPSSEALRLFQNAEFTSREFYNPEKWDFNNPDHLLKLGVRIDRLSKYLIPLIEVLDDLDLHRPYVDRVVYIRDVVDPELLAEEDDRKEMLTREPDLIDVWFDSGAMPYAQLHYPFENKDAFETSYPADFIAEGVDQTRGWFFTLHAIAGMLFDSVSFKNVIANGLVLDKKGNKMSKRLGNAIDPFETIKTYGPDATRWYMIANANPWDNLKFDLNGVAEVQRRFFGTLFNTYNFFALYANLDKFTYEGESITLVQRTESDRWIISKLNSLIGLVDAAYDDYEPTKAARAIQDFVIDDLSNWYVRLNRKRFWKGEYNEDKKAAYQTLYECLKCVAKLASPIAPFYTERIFSDLNSISNLEVSSSVHLTNFPLMDQGAVDKDLEHKMDLAQGISSLVHSLRKKEKIKVRQPLSKILVPILNASDREKISAVADVIISEVNIKEIEYIDDTSSVLVKKIKPNFRKLGATYGPKMKDITQAIGKFGPDDIAKLEREGTYDLALADETISLTLEDVEITSDDIPGWQVASENGLTVALDVTITDDLRREGVARDLVNRIQNVRKDQGLEVQDKIKIVIEKGNDWVDGAVADYRDYICVETQASSLDQVDSLTDGLTLEIDEITVKVKISK